MTRARPLMNTKSILPEPAYFDLQKVGQKWWHAQKNRIAVENRIRNLRRDDDMLEEMIEPWETMLVIADAFEQEVFSTVKEIGKTIPFVQSTIRLPGFGISSLSKLLAYAGDPLWHDEDERLRTSGEWRTICGMNPKRVNGPWGATTRAVLFTMAEAVIKNQRHESVAPLFTIYEEAKERLQCAVHTSPCARCGTVCEQCGKDATIKVVGHTHKKVAVGPGDPLRPGHIHARALRLVMSHFCDEVYRLRKESLT